MLLTTQNKDQNQESVTQLHLSGAHKHLKVGQTEQWEAGPDRNRNELKQSISVLAWSRVEAAKQRFGPYNSQFK